MNTRRGNFRCRPSRGVGAVEFAIVAGIFFTLLLGVVEMGRLMWTWNAAAEATRLGARVAVVCDKSTTQTNLIKAQMVARLPALAASAGTISIDYLDPPNAVNTCTAATCKSVRVSLSGYTHSAIIPFIPMTVTLPPFSTTLRREYMSSTGNSVC